jgi:hypothetical protein
MRTRYSRGYMIPGKAIISSTEADTKSHYVVLSAQGKGLESASPDARLNMGWN